MKKTAFKYIYKIHTYLGLFVAAHFLIFALTGVPLLFKDEFLSKPTTADLAALNVSEDNKSGESIGKQYDRIVADLKARFPNDRLLALFPDDEDLAQINVRLGIDGSDRLRGARKLVYDLNTSQEIEPLEKTGAGFFDWILQLHREFFLGSNGKIYVGFVGMLYVFILISGFFIYGNFMKNRSLGAIRSSKLPKLVDLHKYVGIMTFGWSLVVGLSGAILGFNGVLIKLFQYQSFNHLAAQYEIVKSVDVENFNKPDMAPLEKIVESALSQKNDWTISYISYPDTEFGIPDHYLMLINGTTPITERISELAVVHAKTADLTEVIELPFYLKLAMLSEPLHFGDYGGWTLKIIWALFTLCSLAVVVFGVMSFILKRRKRSKSLLDNESDNTVLAQPSSPNAPSEDKKADSSRLLKWEALKDRWYKHPVFKKTYLLPTLISFAVIVSAVVLLFDDSIFSLVAFFCLIIPLSFIFLFKTRS